MTPSKNWLQRLWSKDRRSADRCLFPPLIAHYWTGGPPSGQRIRDISHSGLFLQTDQKWYPGTIVRITLQRNDITSGNPERYMTVQGMVVRDEPDGAGFAFILPAITRKRRRLEGVDLVVDKESLEKFVNKLKEKNIEVCFDAWVD